MEPFCQFTEAKAVVAESRDAGLAGLQALARRCDLFESPARAVQRPGHGHLGDAEHLGDLARAEREHVAQDEHSALPRREPLQPGNEREPDRFPRLVASFRLL